jgi:hypothetical protein
MNRTNGRTCPLVLYEPNVLEIFSEYSLKIPQIYLNISLSDSHNVYWTSWTDKQTVRTDGHPDAQTILKGLFMGYSEFSKAYRI